MKPIERINISEWQRAAADEYAYAARMRDNYMENHEKRYLAFYNNAIRRASWYSQNARRDMGVE